MFKYRKEIKKAWTKPAQKQQRNTAPAPPLKAKTSKSASACRPKGKGKIAKLEAKVKCLAKEGDQSNGTMTFRDRSSRTIKCAFNEQAAASSCGTTASQGETILAQLKFFDPVTPGTLITGSGATGTYQRNYLIKSVTQTGILRNNYQTDVVVKVYHCRVKGDTNLTPYDCWNNGRADAAYGNATTMVKPLHYPTDFDVFTKGYSSKVVLNTTLSPGQSAKYSNTERDINVDPAVIDSGESDFVRMYKNSAFLVVVNGTVGHDSAGTSIGSLPGGVDILEYITYIVKYDAGVNIKYIYTTDNVQTISAAAVQSHQPTPDNVAYSVT
jgi:hypothetical protein